MAKPNEYIELLMSMANDLMTPPAVATITLVDNPTTTNYHFGPLSDLGGKTLTVIDRCSDGSRLCYAPNGNAIVDVDYRDIKTYNN